MGLGSLLMDIFSPLMESIAPLIPGEVFPYFFTMELFQRALLAAILVTIVAGFLGTFLLIRNLALIGDGLAHVSFGGVAIGVVLGSSGIIWRCRRRYRSWSHISTLVRTSFQYYRFYLDS